MRCLNKAVFLDRDGVLNVEKGYICSITELEVFPYVKECIHRLHEAGFLAIVVSNQSGVARGLFTEEDLVKMNDYLIIETQVDEVFYCPFYTGNGAVVEAYRHESEDRKPGLGMIKKACDKYSIDLTKSFMIGDRITDLQTGANAGIKSILIVSKLTDEAEIPEYMYIQKVYNLIEATEYILRNR